MHHVGASHLIQNRNQHQPHIRNNNECYLQQSEVVSLKQIKDIGKNSRSITMSANCCNWCCKGIDIAFD